MEFDELRTSLSDARAERAAVRRLARAADERLRAVQRRRDDLLRRSPDSDELAALADDERRARAERDRLIGADEAAVGVLADRWKEFERFANPIDHVARLDDSSPILLLPLRIETRFKDVPGRDGGVRQQLWVRVYPDDIAVDTFEELLAESEIANARIYWTNVWKAGGADAAKRAAWRSIVTSHGAGRARWIIDQVAPSNPAEEPVVAAGEHVLVIVTEQPLPAAEREPARAFWRAVFGAAADTGAFDAAFADLVTALGQTRAEIIAAQYAPTDLTPPPGDPPTAVHVAFCDLPDQATIDSQQLPWSHAANTATLPERLVVLGFDGAEQTLFHVGRPIPPELSIGPDPSAPEAEQLRIEDDELVVPDELAWMTDFDAAVATGMGFRIDLSPTQARAGFDRLFVLGVRLSADASAGATDLEGLIAHHQRSRKGFSLLAQGAPTNNVEDAASGYTWREDPDFSYDHFFGTAPSDPDDWRDRRDGRWLAGCIGIDAEVLKSSPNYFGVDQVEARAMNEALWPATLGYLMDEMMEPVFGDDAIDSTRSWFTRYVVGRGTIPAVRVGRQPYGILPVTPFSRIGWVRRELLASDRFDTGIPDQFRFLTRLHAVLRGADADWTALAAQVSYVGRPGVDPHQALLDVVGLHPSSVEYYHRYAETAEQLFNRFQLSGHGGTFLAALIAMGYVASGQQLLERFGHQPGDDGAVPEILDKLFLEAPNLLKGPVVDVGPLSETEAIVASRADGTNYLEWLATAARLSHDALRRQDGFVDDRPPTALLYLMLRHALDVGYVATGVQLHVEAELLAPDRARLARREPKFVHVDEAVADPGSPWQYLYTAAPAITGDAQLTVERFIPLMLALRNPYLNTQIEAIERLGSAPTARLERCFAEHIDCCTNRLDAWWLGLLNVQLELMASLGDNDNDGDSDNDGQGDGDGDGERPGRRGCYLGAYGWVEDLRPDHRTLAPVDLPAELAEIFDRPGQAPLGIDARNFGYIHAPSLDHAVTAAVLRNGYLANATPADPDALSVNLSSERVRRAMEVIDGMRNGQPLGALLGYRLERGLHDRPGLFLDAIIFELRAAFPLVANHFSTTRVGGEPIQAVEARNVVDGRALVEHVAPRTGAARQYPWGLTDLPAISDAAARAAIDDEVEGLIDINDAVADLALSESVYQVVRGNSDRAASTLEAFGKGGFPPIPEVVQTPRRGITLTHRVGIHVPAGLDPDDAALTTPRAKGEPGINAWLAGVLPSMSTVYCVADFFDHSLGADRSVELTAADLGLLPVDLLYAFQRDGEQDMSAIDDLVVQHVRATEAPRADADVRIRYRDRRPGRCSMFELAPLVADLHALLVRSRPLRATDTRLPNEAATTEDVGAVIRPLKVTRVRDLLDARRADLDQYVTDLAALLDDPVPEVAVANAIDNIDDLVAGYTAIADAVGRFGLPGAGLGFAWDWRRRTFGALADRLDALVTHWDERLAEFAQRMADFPGLAPTMTPDEQIAWLLDAGLLVSTAVLVPPPSGDPQDLVDELTLTVQPASLAARNTVAGLVGSATGVTSLYRGTEAQLPTIAAHDPDGFAVAAVAEAIVAFAAELRSKAETLLADLVARVAAADDAVAAAATAEPEAAVDALTAAIRRLLNADFVVLPEFVVGGEQAAEWQGAYDDRTVLLDYLRNDLDIDFPVDDWTCGVARVREKLHHVESATVLTELLAGGSLALTPVQFPRRPDDRWLAMQFPPTAPDGTTPFTIDEDKLLYTAHYPSPFVASAPALCGVLVDEWTEVIPRTDETTGLAFHYDRPNTEPPQTLLLALPADFTGSWSWDDLVDSLHETLDMARKRAVEPRHVDTTAYARFLPATLSSVTRYPIFQVLDLAFNNAVQFAASDGGG